MSKEYKKEDIIDILCSVYNEIQRPITYSILIEKKNIPTRKVLTRLFGNWQNACKEANVPYECKKKKYNIYDAQKELDERNGNFDILEYETTNLKSKVKCRTCNHIWDVQIYSLYDNISNSKGCPQCYINNCKFTEQLQNNCLIRIKYFQNGKGIYKCVKCGYEFEAYLNNVTYENFHCQNCSKVDDKQYKMIKLLDDSLQSYYILGFLFADGHFSSNGRINLMLQQSDKNIIDKIVQYLEIQDSTSMEKRAYGFHCMDTYTYTILKDTYNICSNKTENPCDLSSLNNDNFLAFLIGFIDGDGHIGFRSDTKAPKITIKLHQSWENNLNLMSKMLYKLCGKNKYPNVIKVTQKQGVYASVTFGDKDVLKMLANFIAIIT